jgi:Zn-dependent protease with chaperone function
MLKTGFAAVIMATVLLIPSSCSKESGGGFNIFTVDDDIAFGQSLKQEIEANPAEYPLLSESQYAAAYQHLYRIRDTLLNTGLVAFDDKFSWEMKIIKNDTVVNAFAGPGGYCYFYTGLIKTLDDEAEFAGVMAHEMAHASRRHITQQLTKVYGIELLLSIALGQNPSVLAQIIAGYAAGAASLAFSRDAEYEADEYSVRYLYPTSYDARGVGDFFQKLEGTSPVPEFLSTHPSPEHRYEKIQEMWSSLGGKIGEVYTNRYNDFKSSLP